MKKTLANEMFEKKFAENVWLNYFNQYLYENGVISEKEYKKMTENIAIRNDRICGGKR
jgi:hypothetical protein